VGERECEAILSTRNAVPAIAPNWSPGSPERQYLRDSHSQNGNGLPQDAPRDRSLYAEFEAASENSTEAATDVALTSCLDNPCQSVASTEQNS
jgi:hypothetical protein